MSYTGFRATGRNATTSRPVDKAQAVAGATWFKDRSSAGADDGTEVDATWLNRVRANLENLVAWLGGAGNTGDEQLKDAFAAKFEALQAANDAALNDKADAAAVTAALAGKVDEGSDLTALADGGGFVRMTDAERAKLETLEEHYCGAYASLSALSTAHPSASAGDWAILTHGSGSPATFAAWDSDNAPAAWVDTGASAPTTIDWSSVTGKPSTFAPSAHTHSQSDITNLTTDLAAKAPASRQIAAGGLATGGGDLSADLTITVPKSSNAQAVAGIDDTTAMTPARVADAIAALSPSGGRTEIARTTVSTGEASVEFAGTWTSYKALLLVATGVSGASTASINASVSDDNGSTYKTVSGVEAHTLSVTYVTSVDFNNMSTTTATKSVLETAALNSANVPCLGSQTAATVNGNFSLFIEDVATSSIAKHIVARGSSQTSGKMQFSIGQTASMGAINRLKIAASTGDIDAGTYILYGIE